MGNVRHVVIRRPPFAAYPVLIADGLSPGWSRSLPVFSEVAGIVALFCDTRLPAEVTEPVVRDLREACGDRLVVCPTQAGESRKCPASLAAIYEMLAGAGVRRDGLVIAFGGGTMSDLVGYAASTWHRGVRWAVLPTSLLAQVDAAVGGKVAINLDGLKNQVGAFHQPRAVVADVTWLAHLPASAFQAGMGEVLKYAVGFDPYLWDLLDRLAPIDSRQTTPLRHIVERCVAIKARHVAFDERDENLRKLLNLGHTFAHMLEGSGACTDHGIAVALGVVAATRLAIRLGLCDGGVEQSVVGMAQRLCLPTRVSSRAADPQRAWDADKKHGTAHRVVVVPRRIGSCRLLHDPPREAVWEAFRSLFA